MATADGQAGQRQGLAAAKQLYGRLFGVEPYMDELYYAAFNVAGEDVGLDPGWLEVARQVRRLGSLTVMTVWPGCEATSISP